jgi:hypothetical protein
MTPPRRRKEEKRGMEGGGGGVNDRERDLKKGLCKRGFGKEKGGWREASACARRIERRERWRNERTAERGKGENVSERGDVRSALVLYLGYARVC